MTFLRVTVSLLPVICYCFIHSLVTHLHVIKKAGRARLGPPFNEMRMTMLGA